MKITGTADVGFVTEKNSSKQSTKIKAVIANVPVDPSTSAVNSSPTASHPKSGVYIVISQPIWDFQLLHWVTHLLVLFL